MVSGCRPVTAMLPGRIAQLAALLQADATSKSLAPCVPCATPRFSCPMRGGGCPSPFLLACPCGKGASLNWRSRIASILYGRDAGHGAGPQWAGGSRCINYARNNKVEREGLGLVVHRLCRILDQSLPSYSPHRPSAARSSSSARCPFLKQRSIPIRSATHAHGQQSQRSPPMHDPQRRQFALWHALAVLIIRPHHLIHELHADHPAVLYHVQDQLAQCRAEQTQTAPAA